MFVIISARRSQTAPTMSKTSNNKGIYGFYHPVIYLRNSSPDSYRYHGNYKSTLTPVNSHNFCCTHEAPRHKVRRIGKSRGSEHVTPGGSDLCHVRPKQTPEMDELELVDIKNAQRELLTPSELGERAS